MPDKDEIYRIWAPAAARWSRWVKPVLFAFMDGVFEVPPARVEPFQSDWVPAPGAAAIVVDLPGDQGVLWGVQLARLGYQPIPLYNAMPFPLNQRMSEPDSRPGSTVDVEPILAALYREAGTVQQIKLPANAPPAFLLDANRRVARFKPSPGFFDNRSVCFSTDFPSPQLLFEHGIRSAIIVQQNANVADDLLLTLTSWQERGIYLFCKKPREAGPPSPLVLKRPSFLGLLWRRIKLAVGRRPGELGAFGEIVGSASG